MAASYDAYFLDHMRKLAEAAQEDPSLGVLPCSLLLRLMANVDLMELELIHARAQAIRWENEFKKRIQGEDHDDWGGLDGVTHLMLGPVQEKEESDEQEGEEAPDHRSNGSLPH